MKNGQMIKQFNNCQKLFFMRGKFFQIEQPPTTNAILGRHLSVRSKRGIKSRRKKGGGIYKENG